MNNELVSTFLQDMNGQEYEDKLSKYFKLHYELLTNMCLVDCHIGEVYRKAKENEYGFHEYIVIVHQIGDKLHYKNLVYDVNGNLINPMISGCLCGENPLEGYILHCTYADLMSSRNLRMKIGLEAELSIALKRQDEFKAALQKINKELGFDD